MFLARVAARSVLGRPAVRTLRPAVRGLRSSVVLPSRQSSGNSADQDGFASDDRHVIGALVVNESGVLAGVATLLAGRGFNIDSLVVGRTEIPELSRMTIVINGDDSALTNVRAVGNFCARVLRAVGPFMFRREARPCFSYTRRLICHVVSFNARRFKSSCRT